MDAILTRTQEMRRQMQNSRSWPKHTRQVANVKRTDFEGSTLRTGKKPQKTSASQSLYVSYSFHFPIESFLFSPAEC